MLPTMGEVDAPTVIELGSAVNACWFGFMLRLFRCFTCFVVSLVSVVLMLLVVGVGRCSAIV